MSLRSNMVKCIRARDRKAAKAQSRTQRGEANAAVNRMPVPPAFFASLFAPLRLCDLRRRLLRINQPRAPHLAELLALLPPLRKQRRQVLAGRQRLARGIGAAGLVE